MATLRTIVGRNLKYIRYQTNLSQEDFAEKVGSNLVYINQIENLKRKPTIEMLDKIADGMNKNIDKNLKITGSDLIKYDANHKTDFVRIDEKKQSN